MSTCIRKKVIRAFFFRKCVCVPWCEVEEYLLHDVHSVLQDAAPALVGDDQAEAGLLPAERRVVAAVAAVTAAAAAAAAAPAAPAAGGAGLVARLRGRSQDQLEG